MRIYIDESGTFTFPEAAPFDVHALGGVAVPNSGANEVEIAVAGLRERFGATELHGADLSDDELCEACAVLGRLPLAVSVILTDSNLVPANQIQSWRDRQESAAAEAYANSRARALGDEKVEAAVNRIRKRIELPTRVAHGEFVQFGMMMPQAVFEVGQAAFVLFRDPKWGPDFIDWRFIYDAKLAGKLSAGEKYLKETLPMTLSGDPRFVWSLPPEWREANHPFIDRFVAEDGITLDGIVVGTMAFEDSKAHSGLQIADVAVHTLRRAALAPLGSTAARAWRELGPVTFASDGRAARLFAIRDFPLHEVARYGNLL